jgi:hypothetical protein
MHYANIAKDDLAYFAYHMGEGKYRSSAKHTPYNLVTKLDTVENVLKDTRQVKLMTIGTVGQLGGWVKYNGILHFLLIFFSA